MPGIRSLSESVTNNPAIEQGFRKLYGSTQVRKQKNRYLALIEQAGNRFTDTTPFFISAPGRTELGGNHTDHNNGRVLASAVDLDCVILAAPTADRTVTLFSDKLDNTVTVDFETLSPLENEKGTPDALIRGVASALLERSIEIKGFCGFLDSTCQPGTGLSSSAAISVLIGAVFSHLDKKQILGPVELARVAQYAENNYFGKPCGLMDQMSSAIGGTLAIDFQKPYQPIITHLQTDLNSFGYQMAIVNTGDSHAKLTPQYAAIPEEISLAVKVFNRNVARGISLEMLFEKLPEIRSTAGDRAALRLMHFIREDIRATEQAKALSSKDFQTFLKLTEQSGKSSCSLLQNCSSATETKYQGILLALAITAELCPESVSRVHGGGFAGTIQAYIPKNEFEKYNNYMTRIFGQGSVMPVRTGRPGVCSLTENGWFFPPKEV